MSQANYRVDLLGIAWQGFTGAYSYTFDHAPTELEIKAKAGDFQHIIDYEVTQIVHSGDWSKEVTERSIVKAWKDEANELMYQDCAFND